MFLQIKMQKKLMQIFDDLSSKCRVGNNKHVVSNAGTDMCWMSAENLFNGTGNNAYIGHSQIDDAQKLPEVVS